MGRCAKARQVLDLIQAVAEKHGGKLSVVWKEAGCTGAGYVRLPKWREVVFNFSFTPSGYDIEISGEAKTFSRLRPYMGYDDRYELEAALKRIEVAIQDVSDCMGSMK